MKILYSIEIKWELFLITTQTRLDYVFNAFCNFGRLTANREGDYVCVCVFLSGELPREREGDAFGKILMVGNSESYWTRTRLSPYTGWRGERSWRSG